MNSKDRLDILKKSIPMWMAAVPRMKVSRRGKEYDVLCPYHADTVPSFQIYKEEDGTWLGHCQACGATKNIFQFVSTVDKISFQEAVKVVEDMTKNPEWEKKRAAADAVFQGAIPAKKENITIPLAAFDSYRTALRGSQSAQEWLRSRGISTETAEDMNLGFVQKPMTDLVPTNNPLYGQGWILFPEVRGKDIVAVKYRSIVAKKTKDAAGKSWSGFAQRKDMMKSLLYNYDAISMLEDLFVVEGEPDCLVMSQAGFCCVSLPSAGFSPTPDMRDQFMIANSRYLSGDMDEQGVNAMLKLYKELGGETPHSKTYLMKWPKPCKDANETFLKVCKGDVEAFRNLVIRLMDEAKSNQVPGIQDLKTVTQNMTCMSTKDNPNRLTFPWPSIDAWVDILPGEVMFLFATETKMGKSTWLMNVLVDNVLQGRKVVNFSAELSPQRYASMVTARLVQQNRNSLTQGDFHLAASLIPEETFYFGYKPGVGFKDVMKLLETAKQVYGGDIFVVDPLHFLIRGGTPGQENSEFAAAMKMLVDFSIKWNVIVIVVGQPRKALQGNRGRMAQGQDARGTAALGEDAATTWILHRNRVQRPRSAEESEEEAVFEAVTTVKLDYSRNSEARMTKLIFDGPKAMFNKLEPGALIPMESQEEQACVRGENF